MRCLSYLPKALALATIVGLTALVAAMGPANAAQKGRKTSAAVTSSLPVGTHLNARALAHHIDAAIDARIAQEQVSTSPLADDAELLRRIYLDLVGHIPSAEKVVAFLADRSADKRARLIDELLASADFGRRQADVWQALLLPRNSDNRAVQFDAMTKWLADSFNDNKPWDKLVRDVITASGEAGDNPGVAYVLANRGPDKLTDNVTRMFLGVQLQCAQCHNHPFTGWKQDEYWGMAAFFSKVRFEGNPRAANKGGPVVKITEGDKGRPLPRPESARNRPPKFLQGDEAHVGKGNSYRSVLAQWLTAPKNPFFARAMVNRTWAQLFGRGIVMPVDDMHDGNEPSHPQLLADLADQFAGSNFDLKYLFRALCNSKAYQRTSKPLGSNADAPPELFARMAVKVLTPEQMFDSLAGVLGAPRDGQNQGRPGMGGRPGPATPRAAFVAFFKVEDADPTEYNVGIPQALRLINGPQLNNPAALAPVLKTARGPADVVEQLFLRTLSRKPTPRELDRFTGYVGKYRGEERQAFADVLWALLNCSEFAVNH